MRHTENMCVGCEGYPCIGSACELTHVEVISCDRCGAEDLDIYDLDGEELCGDCVEKSLEAAGEGICTECGDEETLFIDVDGEKKCLNCILSGLERVS